MALKRFMAICAMLVIVKLCHSQGITLLTSSNSRIYRFSDEINRKYIFVINNDLYAADTNGRYTFLYKNKNGSSYSSICKIIRDQKEFIVFHDHSGHFFLTDGTIAGTVQINDKRYWYLGSKWNKLFFYDENKRLIISDGTISGTRVVAESLSLYLRNNNYDKPLAFNAERLFFITGTDEWDGRVFSLDSHGMGLELIHQGKPGDMITFQSDILGQTATSGDKILFTVANYNSYYNHLYSSNGKPGGTSFLFNCIYENDFLIIGDAFRLKDRLIMFARGITRNMNLWVTDGTASGTFRIDSWDDPTADDSPFGVSLDSVFLFRAYRTGTGRELYSTAGRKGDIRLIKDMRPGTRSASPCFIFSGSKQVYLMTSDSKHPPELWRSDGTESGTVLKGVLFSDSDAVLSNRFSYHDKFLLAASYSPGFDIKCINAGGDTFYGFSDLFSDPKAKFHPVLVKDSLLLFSVSSADTSVNMMLTTFRKSFSISINTSTCNPDFSKSKSGEWTLLNRNNFYYTEHDVINGSSKLWHINLNDPCPEVRFPAEITVFPNPSTGRLRIRSSDYLPEKATLRVYSHTGKLVYTEKWSANQPTGWEADLQWLQAGVYLIEISDGQNRLSAKWIRW